MIIPPLSVIERLCAEAITRAERRLYRKLTSGLDEFQLTALDNVLCTRLNTKQSMLAWLRQAPGAANPRKVIEHIERLKAIRSITLPEELGRNIHQNHLLRLARQGAQTPANDFRDLTDERRYATLVAVLLETSATIIDEILDLNHRLLGSFFAKAKRQFESAFQDAGRAINDKVRLYAKIGQALIEAKTSQSDPFLAIESIVPWERFTQTVRASSAQYRNYVIHRSRTKMLPTLSEFTRPVRIIFGDADPYLNKGVAQRFHELFRMSELFLVPGCSTLRPNG